MAPAGMPAAARKQGCLSPENDFPVVVRRPAGIYGIGGHVCSASCGVEETAHCHQSVLRAVGHQVEWRMAAEYRCMMRPAQPVDAFMLFGEQHAQGLMDAEQRRYPRQHIDIESDGIVFSSPLAPAMIGRT